MNPMPRARLRRLLPAVAVMIPAFLPTPAAAAAESAVVGARQADGTIRLYRDRFQAHFADGTPVARIEAATVEGFTRLYRWSADGCRGESTLLKIGGAGFGDLQPVIILTSQPLESTICQDRGCAEEFTRQGHSEAQCGNLGELRCVCVEENLSGDWVTWHTGNYCERVWNWRGAWSVREWVLPQFVQ